MTVARGGFKRGRRRSCNPAHFEKERRDPQAATPKRGPLTKRRPRGGAMRLNRRASSQSDSPHQVGILACLAPPRTCWVLGARHKDLVAARDEI